MVTFPEAQKQNRKIYMLLLDQTEINEDSLEKRIKKTDWRNEYNKNIKAN